MKRIRVIISALTVVIASVFGVFAVANDVGAITVDDLKERFIAKGLYTCYQGRRNGQYIMTNADLIPVKVLGWKTLIPNDGDIVGVSPDYFDSGEDEYSCAKLFEHYGIRPVEYSSNQTADANDVMPILNALGFKPVQGRAGSKECENFNFAPYDEGSDRLDTSRVASLQICGTLNAGGKIDSSTPQVSPVRYQDGSEKDLSIGKTDTGALTLYLSGVGSFELTNPEVYYTQGASTWNEFVDNFAKALENGYTRANYETQNGCSNGLCGYYYLNHNKVPVDEAVATKYQLDRNYYKTLYQEKLGNAYPSLTFSKKERSALYQNYLTSYYGMEIDEDSCVKSGEPKNPDGALTVASQGETGNWHKTKTYDTDGKPRYCYARFNKNTGNTVYGLKTLQPAMVEDGKIGLLDIISTIYDDGLSSIPAELAASTGQPGVFGREETEDGTTVAEEGEGNCFTNAGALGWVLCPALEGVSWAVNQIYTAFIEPALTVNADLFTAENTEGQGAYTTWQTFQTFANIIFVIMILVVIFSQLTGVGIDNYGIKRILPRLIVAAILINLSFIVCQLLVDLSNILGVSLKNLFTGIGPEVGGTGQGSTAGGQVMSTFVVIITAAVATGAFLALGLGIIIPLLIAALSALIAIFFLFLVLSARQAAILILVVISPVAVVLYMLPNTKKYFDKYVSAFATLLLVFPICGLLMGGGDFASRVLLSAGGVAANEFNDTANGFFFQFSAILVSIVPFFFIPSLVKGSLSGLGNIGAKISSIGSKVSGRATGASRGALQNTRLGDPSRFRRWSGVRRAERREAAERDSTIRRAQRRVARLTARRDALGAGEELGAADLRRLSAAQATVERLQGEDLSARTSLAMRDFGTASESAVRDEWRNAFRSGNSDRLKAITSVMQSRFGSNAAKFIGDDLENLEKSGLDVNSDTNAQNSLRALQEYANSDGKFAGDLKSKAFDAHAMITSGGVTGQDAGGNNVYANLSHFSTAGNVGAGKLDTLEDISTQSTGAIRRAVAGGVITGEQAGAVISSTDQRIQSGIASDAGKREELMNARISNPDGTTTSVADRVKAAQADKARDERRNRLEQEENELQIQHHEDAMAIGKRSITVGNNTFDGYDVPAGFTAAGAPQQNADGQWIYTDSVNGRKWNASTGRYVKEDPDAPVVLDW